MKKFIEKHHNKIMMAFFHAICALSVSALIEIGSFVSLSILIPTIVVATTFYVATKYVFKFNIKHVPAGY